MGPSYYKCVYLCEKDVTVSALTTVTGLQSWANTLTAPPAGDTQYKLTSVNYTLTLYAKYSSL